MIQDECLEIHGPCRLDGRVHLEGAKNAALPGLVVSLLADEPLTLENVPDVLDIHNLLAILRSLGLEYEPYPAGVTIYPATRLSSEPSSELVQRIRASFMVLGPLCARTGYARGAYPGGCAIGQRPVDQHLNGLSALGMDVTLHDHRVELKAGNLHGAKIRFDIVTVTGTEHLMMTAALIPDTTILENCAREPEVVQLAEMLTSMGAEIQGAGTERIVIRGRKQLAGGRFYIIPDRIEAGTYIIATLATRGRVCLHPVRRDHMGALIESLEMFQPRLSWENSQTLIVDATQCDSGFPHEIRTEPFPGFPTDLQAQWMVLQTQIIGVSTIEETVFPERFRHALELVRLGAEITVSPPRATVKGKTPLKGAKVKATDLRASACLVVAGLVAEGTTLIQGVEHLDRGYVALDTKLQSLGAVIHRKVADVMPSRLAVVG